LNTTLALVWYFEQVCTSRISLTCLQFEKYEFDNGYRSIDDSLAQSSTGNCQRLQFDFGNIKQLHTRDGQFHISNENNEERVCTKPLNLHLPSAYRRS
jgi:hypothetical protein